MNFSRVHYSWVVFCAFALVSCAAKTNLQVANLESEVKQLKQEQLALQSKIQEIEESVVVLKTVAERNRDRMPIGSLVKSPNQTPLVKPQVELSGASNSDLIEPTMLVKTPASDATPSSFLGVGKFEAARVDKARFSNKDLALARTKSEKQTKTEHEVIKAAKVPAMAGLSDEDQMAGKLYQQAFTHYQSNDLSKARTLFDDFLKKFPKHEYSDNAQFWLAEIEFKQSEFAKAAKLYDEVVKNYPKGNKVPEALLGAGVSYHRIEKVSEAKRSFARLLTDYPSSLAAQEAKSQMSTWEKEKQ